MKKLSALATIAASILLPGTVAAQEILDVHSHNVLPEYIDVLRAHGAELEEGFPLPAWAEDAHLAFMEENGIATTVLSMPAPQPYFGASAECKKAVRQYNEACADLKAKHPGKFLFVASLPLPDVDAAIEEAAYALDVLHADGIKLATNSRGQYLGDPALDPLMAELDKRGAVIILHPHKPVPANDALIANTPLAAFGYPVETTTAVVNMISRNVLVRYPNVKVVVPHVGSFLPLALPRMKAIHPIMLSKGLMQPIDWEGNLSRLYYDLAGGATPDTLKALLTITTPDHLMYGSDFPYQPAAALKAGLERLRGQLAAIPELAPHAEDILGDNARRLFGQPVTERKLVPAAPANAAPQGMLVRISEIEVYPQYLEEYLARAAKVGSTSVREEEGVIAIYPMVQNRDACQIRILEIYADQDAYKKHIASPHFQEYKQGTLHMVKSLDLVDMKPLDPDAMPAIFAKSAK